MAEKTPEGAKKDKEKPRRFRRFIKSNFNAAKWMNLNRIKATNQSLKDLILSFFVVKKGGQEEDFNVATQRLGLNDAELRLRQKQFLFFSGLMLLVALLMFSYAIYLFSTKAFLGGSVGFSATLVALAMAFRYHFWFFQIKKRKLGCTFSEWLRQGFAVTFSNSTQMSQVKK
ncbi:MAG: type IVB secretion system protein IcmV [Proteobacteria bacterium]|nr:type IVB secretion system protein IcmV [Pseudomonadota bacterium]